MVARTGQTVDGTRVDQGLTARGGEDRAQHGQAHGASRPGDRQEADPDQGGGQPQDDRGHLHAEHPEQAGDRYGREQRLLPAVRGQVVNRQGDEDQSRQCKKGAALDLVDLENGQQKSKLRHRPCKGHELTTAGFGLARIQPPLASLLRRLTTGRLAERYVLAVWRDLRCDRTLDFCPHGPAPSRLVSIPGRGGKGAGSLHPRSGE